MCFCNFMTRNSFPSGGALGRRQLIPLSAMNSVAGPDAATVPSAEDR
jgi:hypothetical protein